MQQFYHASNRQLDTLLYTVHIKIVKTVLEYILKQCIYSTLHGMKLYQS